MKKFFKWIGIIFGGLIVLSIIGSLLGNNDNSSSTTEPTKQASEQAQQPKAEEKKVFAAGDVVTVGKFEYKVNGVSSTKVLNSVLGDKTTDGKFLIVDVTVKNLDKEQRMFDSSMFKVLANGNTFEADATLDMYVNDNNTMMFLEQVNPQMSRTGKIVFEVPADISSPILEVSSGVGFASGKYEKIQLP